ncbi:MAG: sigma-70 family RNA polymerase sigma factor [Chloroherpetonaceae bacterium]|nr:sigma-70 family RNA polymerase sigma factor [Chthonomonadaceae bacterium]MDW8209235.1 sigma-70 family RNA polymerase sigma factor [Chloroherpetonaceae bacterium]
MSLATTFPTPPARSGREVGVCHTETDPDLAAIERIRRYNDTRAFGEIWTRHWPGLCAYFHHHVRNREDAEDLASETLLTAQTQLPSFRGQAASAPLTPSPKIGAESPAQATQCASCSFRTYLYAIARNKLARWLRRKRNRPVMGFHDLCTEESTANAAAFLEQKLGPAPEADPLTPLLQEAHRDEICMALAEVGMRSSEQFKALILHYGCKLPHKEIATLLETRSETVNSRLQEGRRTLMRRFAPQHSADGRQGIQ